MNFSQTIAAILCEIYLFFYQFLSLSYFPRMLTPSKWISSFFLPLCVCVWISFQIADVLNRNICWKFWAVDFRRFQKKIFSLADFCTQRLSSFLQRIPRKLQKAGQMLLKFGHTLFMACVGSAQWVSKVYIDVVYFRNSRRQSSFTSYILISECFLVNILQWFSFKFAKRRERRRSRWTLRSVINTRSFWMWP